MRMRRVVVVFAVGVITLTTPLVVYAQGVKDRGLSISPSRQEMTLDAGKVKMGSFVVGDETDVPMKVSIAIKQFSVTDHTYDYRFRAPEYDWIKLDRDTLDLRPRQQTKINFTLAIPASAAGGGYYFALTASTPMTTHGSISTVQVVSLLYVKVNGGKVVQTNHLENDKIPFFVMGSEVPYSYEVKNTGNVHFSGHFYAQLAGFLGESPEDGEDHVILPGTTRDMSGSIPAPLLPGLYSLTYGYKIDHSSEIVEKKTYFIYAPPWSLAALFLGILIIVWSFQKIFRKKR